MERTTPTDRRGDRSWGKRRRATNEGAAGEFMDAGGDKERRLVREGVGVTSSCSAPSDKLWGPHPIAESEGEETAAAAVGGDRKDADDSDVALETVDMNPEYALIPVEEGDEEEQEQVQAKVNSEGTAQAMEADESGDKTEQRPPSEAKEAATCLPDAPTTAPSPAAPDTSDAAPIPVDADAAEPGDATVMDDAAERGDADVVVAEPSPTASSQGGGDRQQQEEAIELSLVLSDSSVEPSMSEATQERVDVESVCTPLNTDAEVDVVAQSNRTSAPPLPITRRKRKRSKKMSFSSRPRGAALARLKLEGLKPPPVAVTSEQSDHAHGKKRHLDPAQQMTPGASPGQESTFLYPSTPTGTAWQWDSCEMYFAPIRQENLDDLERIRKSQANFMAANPQLCRGIQAERAQLDAMMSDASDRSSARLQLDQRRGRYYRDTWEEEDFSAAAQRKLDDEEEDVPAVVQSNHDLVFGYDDDLFRDYVARLESAVATAVSNVSKSGEVTPTPQPETKSSQPQRTTAAARRSSKQSSSKRGKKAARLSSPKQLEPVAHSPLEDVLPLLPCHELHPASLGWWKLVKDKHVKEPSFSVVHPASLSRDRVPVRWIEEAEAYRKRIQKEQEAKSVDDAGDSAGDASDNTNGLDSAESETKAGSSGSTSETVTNGFQKLVPLKLPSFGDAGLEQDEISRAIAASAAKLVPLSMVNWRALQTVYERAACAQQCASIFDAEAAAKKSLEHLYTSMFAPPQEYQPAGDNNAVSSTAGVSMGRDRQPVSLSTRPRDLVAFSSRSSLSGDDASVAVAASVEFAMSLQMGDVVDALDRSGCWNDGVVLDVFTEGGRYPKFVLVRLALWSHEVVEWVGVFEGRLLPRGVAAGKMEFVLSRSQFRNKKLTLTRQIANVLEQSFSQRRARLAAATQKEAQFRARLMQLEDGKALQKRKRRRVGSASAVV